MNPLLRITVFTAILALATAQCGSGLSSCNGQCYIPTANSCPTDQVTFKQNLCPLNFGSCNGACYSPTQYHCANGGLQAGAASGNTPSTQAQTPATSSVQVTPTSSAQAPVTSNSCTSMFAGLTCRTASEDPTKVDPNAVAGARGWLCSTYPVYCTAINAGGAYASCNNVEQLSYAMNAYYNAYQYQGPSACNFGGIAVLVSTSTPTPTPVATSSQSPSNTVSTTSQCQAMFAQASCRTASEDPTQVNSASVAGARGWLCGAYPQFCTAISSGGAYSSCNSVEQLTYAMSLYYNQFQSQGPSACSFGGLAVLNTGSTPAPSTSASPAPTQAAPATSSTQAVVASSTKAAAATTASQQTCNTAGCGGGTCNCNGQCYSPSTYNCPMDPLTGKYLLCWGSFGACNGQCYDTTAYSCKNGGLVQGGGQTPTPTQAAPATSSTQAAPATTSNPTPVVNPNPVPNQYPTQTADLRIINSCKTTLWFEARYGNQGAPIPGQSATATVALPGSYVDYTIPSTGLSGSRFWAKYGCNSQGKNCLVGDQMQYWPNPPGGCPVNGCTPPVDSLFEATWGCRPGTSCNSANPTTWFDTSQVDGWTIPYKLTPNGDTSGCDCTGSGCGFTGVDASRLDLERCPRNENLVAGGQSSINVNGQAISLSSVDLRIINNGSVIGCMSPCKRLNWGAPYGLGQDESSGSALWMCCPTPTPDNCSPSNGCVLPQACKNGPIETTQFVSAVHDMAPGVYSFSYDDGVGLHACPAGVVTYTMEFCPSGSSAYPAPL